MPVFSMQTIGNNLLAIRRRTGLTQAELAERAGLSDRTYADIERGISNMRVDTLLRICSVLKVTPNDVLSFGEEQDKSLEEIIAILHLLSPSQRSTVLKLIAVYLNSLGPIG